jgi:glycine cleavage system H lipoate-binding protein
MWCTFLKEAEVRFCEASPFRKMIRRAPLPSDHEPCSSPAFRECPLAAGRPEARTGRSTCPFLRQVQMLYCAAAPALRYIPYSDALVSKCQGEAHRYCDVYLSVADPHGAHPVPDEEPEVPPHLFYAPNHMWLDVARDRTCVVGLDAFLVRVLGLLDAVTFVSARGVRRPAVSLTVRGVDLSLVFPNPIEITGTNLDAREDPARVVADPYVRGWLFTGRDVSDEPAAVRTGAAAGLRTGSEAAAWMREEWERATRFLHDWLGRSGLPGAPVLMDGGVPAAPIAAHLERADLLGLLNEFFGFDPVRREA